MYLSSLPEIGYVHDLGAEYQWRPEEGVRCPEAGVTDACEPFGH